MNKPFIDAEVNQMSVCHGALVTRASSENERSRQKVQERRTAVGKY